jgi:very-short-patch-repair endonuclease
MKEKNLVVQGPPGTGKSQTITNIIANALAKNKTILFLSKKQAALGVVKRRLDTAGLGDFCLELHSDKSSPKHVIESLKKRTAIGYVAGREPPPSDEKALVQNRKDLNGYLEALKKSEPDDESVYDLMWRALRAEVALGEHFKAFKNIEFPNDLLDDPSTLKSLTDPIAIYAGICGDFCSRYGEPNASSWYSLEFGDGAHQGIVSGLLDDLEQLQESAGRLQTLIAQAGDLGVFTISEVETIIALEQLLPVRVPPGAIVEMVAGVPAHVIETLVRLQLDFNAAKAQAQQLPDLSNANESLLERIGRMGAATAASGYDELLPSEAVTRAHKDIDEATALQSIIESFTPAIEILGLTRSLQANALEAIHISVRSAQYLNGEVLAWFQWMPAGGLETFKEAKAEWTVLQETETKWRAKHHGNKDKAWPSPDELLSVARLRRKGLLGKMLGSVSGDSKAIAALVQKMGGPAGAKPDPAKLEALAAHIQVCTAFVHNENFRRVFGTAWRGFNTNFNRIGKILDFQQTIKSVLQPLPFGPQIFEILWKADEDALKRLAADQRATELYKKLPASLQQRLDERSIEAISHDFASEIIQARAVIASDPDGAVGLLNWPIRELREAIIAKKRRRQAQAALRDHSSVEMYGSLVRDEQAIENTRTVLSWITTVKGAAGIPAPIAKGLLSGQCAVLRPRLAEFAKSASAELDRCSNHSTEIAARYDVCGFNLRDSAKLASHLDDLLAHRDELGDFLALRNQRRLLEDVGLGAFIREYEKRGLQLAELPIVIDGVAAFKRAAHKRSANHTLRDANGIKLDQKRKLFARQDKGKLDRDRTTVRNILTAKQPPAGSRIGAKKTWTDMALLQNEFSKEKKFVPVRGLMTRASAAIQTLKPCFMMSPLSLAKFLPAGKVRFDLIVIDEASQMLPEEALGALWRAKQFVVVGDQKQLPPTDLFARADGATMLTNDEEDMDGIDDADGESILEVCGNAFGQPRMLRWHYRSRCESLIAFSNAEFYHDELVTFPAARPGAFSVNLVKLRGNYKKGRNPAEAQIVAEEAIRFMRKHAALDVKDIPTIGIVAVNSQQRDLINEELRLLEADDPGVEEYRKKVEEKGDPVTVWNLENVQGDERDFIFVSLTYGPEPGLQKVHQRFGPINGKNGHRRLNVLFTRARSRLILFTSMSSSDVLCEPGKSAEGVRILKSYLEYAERGGKTGGTLTGKGADSDFEVSVAERLRRRGYSVETQVGVSGYKIDLGIRHPDHLNRFIAGVECDGAAYHSSKSARDRDRLREEILRELGWTIIRVWSTDWFDNPGVQTDRLVAAIEELRRRPVLQDEEYRPETISEPQSRSETIGEAVSEVHSRNTEAEIKSLSSNGASPSAATHVAKKGRLTREEVFNHLRQFRETVIAKEMDGTWEPHRSIARDAMIEALIEQRFDDPLQWINKIPRFLRTGTNPVEKKRYLHQLCEIVNRLDV